MKKPYLIAQWLFSLALLAPSATYGDTLRALILLKNPKQLIKPKNSEKLQGAYVFGMIPPGNWNLLRMQLETAALDRPIDAETIDLLSQILIQWYQENGEMRVRVVVLAEDLDGDGILQLAIVPDQSIETDPEPLYESLDVGEIAQVDLPEESKLLTSLEVDFDDLLEISSPAPLQPTEETEEEIASVETTEAIQQPPAEEVVVVESAAEESIAADGPSLPTGRAIILLQDPSQLLSAEVTADLSGAYIIGELDLGDAALLEQALNDIYLNQPIDESTLPALAQLIGDWYGERLGREVEIIIPEQSLDQGVLQLVVIELDAVDLPTIETKETPYQEVAETASELSEPLAMEEIAALHEETPIPAIMEEDSLAEEPASQEVATLEEIEIEALALTEEAPEESTTYEEPPEIAIAEEVSTPEVAIEEEIDEEIADVEPEEQIVEEESEEIVSLEEEPLEEFSAESTIVEEKESEEVVVAIEAESQELAIVDEKSDETVIEAEPQEILAVEEVGQEGAAGTAEEMLQELLAIELEPAEPTVEEEENAGGATAVVVEEEATPIAQQTEPQQEFVLPPEEEVLEVAAAEPEAPIPEERRELLSFEEKEFSLAEEESSAPVAAVEAELPEPFTVETQESIAVDREEEQVEVAVTERDAEESPISLAVLDEEEQEAIVITESIEEPAEVAIVEESLPESRSTAPIGKALVLINDADKLLSPEEERACEGTCIFGSPPPGDLAMLQQFLETLYLDKPLDDETIDAVQLALEEWYQGHGAVNVTVAIPEQSLTEGVLQLVIGVQGSEEIAEEEIFSTQEELIAAAPEEQAAPQEESEALLFRGIQLLGSTVPEELDELLADLYLGQPLDEQLIREIQKQLANWMEENGISDVQLTLQGEPTSEGLLLFNATESLAIAANEAEPVAEEIAESSSTPVGKALILLGSEDHLFEDSELDSMEGTSAFGLAPPGDMADLQKILDEIYLDHPLDEQTIQALKLALYQWYEDHNDDSLEVVIPEQTLVNGAIQIILNSESTNQNPLDQRSSLQPRGRTLLLVDSQEHLLPLEEAEKFTGVNTVGLKLPGTFASLQAKLAPVYLGQPLNMETINAVKQAIYQWYEERDYPFVLVTVPPQKVTHGVVQMMILKAKLGEVSVEGNQWFSDNCLKKYVKIQPGQDIDVYTLQSDLNFINRNPFRRVNMLYTAGAQAGMTDVILTVEDRAPYQVYVGTENTGMVGTERNRVVSGFSIGKLFGLDHIINFQYTGAFEYQKFSACSGQYMMLLPWGHMINIYGGYSALHANIITPHNSNVGKSIQSSFRYTIPCHQEPGFMGEVSLGFDFKSTNNTLAFTSAFANYSSIVNVSQLVAEYRLWREWPTRRVEITTQAYWSPGEILPHESNSDYNRLRPGAVNQWIYGRTTFRYLERLPMGFTFSFWARGQYSSQNLLPSEQMGIGGYSTVRGYDENQLTMDRAFIANVEFRTPAIPIIAMVRKYPVKDGLQFLLFADYGMGNNHNAIGTQHILESDYLLGVGPGIRYTLDPYLSARLDWGIRLHNQTDFYGDISMIHFSTIFSY